jgi:hypothetical protein
MAFTLTKRPFNVLYVQKTALLVTKTFASHAEFFQFWTMESV